MTEFTQEQAHSMYEALKDLSEVCGEANIPLVSTKAVRQMARFVDARQTAEGVLEEVRPTAQARLMESIR